MGKKSRRWKNPVSPQYWAAGPKRFAWATRMIDWEDEDPAHKLAPYYSNGQNDPFTKELMETGRYSELLSLTAEKIGPGTRIAVDIVPRNEIEKSEHVYTYLSEGSDFKGFKAMSSLGASVEMRFQLFEQGAFEKYSGVELEIPTQEGGLTFVSAMKDTQSGTTLSVMTPTQNREALMPYVEAFSGNDLLKIKINPENPGLEPYCLSVHGVAYEPSDLVRAEDGSYSIVSATVYDDKKNIVTPTLFSMLNEVQFMLPPEIGSEITGLSAFGYSISDIGHLQGDELTRVYAVYSES